MQAARASRARAHLLSTAAPLSLAHARRAARARIAGEGERNLRAREGGLARRPGRRGRGRRAAPKVNAPQHIRLPPLPPSARTRPSMAATKAHRLATACMHTHLTLDPRHARTLTRRSRATFLRAGRFQKQSKLLSCSAQRASLLSKHGLNLRPSPAPPRVSTPS
eukprot:2690230-Pleurochrysis_carterae.AAC.3